MRVISLWTTRFNSYRVKSDNLSLSLTKYVLVWIMVYTCIQYMLHIRLEAFRIDGYVKSSFLNLPLHLNVDKFDKIDKYYIRYCWSIFLQYNACIYTNCTFRTILNNWWHYIYETLSSRIILHSITFIWSWKVFFVQDVYYRIHDIWCFVLVQVITSKGMFLHCK